MMVKPTVSELLEKIGDNRYSLIIMASRRARQIAAGAEKLVDTDSTSPVTIAAEEIAAGKVKAVSDEEETKE
jgi:DNA-directed RNA polymerase subunit omega